MDINNKSEKCNDFDKTIIFKPKSDDNELVDYKCVIGGDNKFLNIACASILAKEYHDKTIRGYIEEKPHFLRASPSVQEKPQLLIILDRKYPHLWHNLF